MILADLFWTADNVCLVQIYLHREYFRSDRKMPL